MSVPWWWWGLGVLLLASLVIAVLAYVDAWAGVVFSVAAAFAIAVLLAGYTLRVQVDDDALVVGRYRLEGRYIAAAEPFEGESARRILGPEADHSALLQTRPYTDALVRIVLDDPADPHASWLISTRRPQELAEAVRSIL